jgi:Flp pilus assembly protein TadD
LGDAYTEGGNKAGAAQAYRTYLELAAGSPNVAAVRAKLQAL